MALEGIYQKVEVFMTFSLVQHLCQTILLTFETSRSKFRFKTADCNSSAVVKDIFTKFGNLFTSFSLLFFKIYFIIIKL